MLPTGYYVKQVSNLDADCQCILMVFAGMAVLAGNDRIDGNDRVDDALYIYQQTRVQDAVGIHGAFGGA